MFHARTKHIAIDNHFVRDIVAKKSLTVKFLSSKDQLVDVLTKTLVYILDWLFQIQVIQL